MCILSALDPRKSVMRIPFRYPFCFQVVEPVPVVDLVGLYISVFMAARTKIL